MPPASGCSISTTRSIRRNAICSPRWTTAWAISSPSTSACRTSTRGICRRATTGSSARRLRASCACTRWSRPISSPTCTTSICRSSAGLTRAWCREIERLPGRKLIYTNGSRRHAERVAEKLGVLDLFEDICDIVACDYVPKPRGRCVQAHGGASRRDAAQRRQCSKTCR